MFMSTWLPPEIGRSQPYSMGPLTRWDDTMARISPALGAVVSMDRPDMAVKTCLVAPAAVQRQAQRSGIGAIMMVRVPGLIESLNDPRYWPIGSPLRARFEAEKAEGTS